ncbi:MAG: site-specific integrase, partial [Methylococcus sp.]|nr:site-specific integrase [Methylococcus sp.]
PISPKTKHSIRTVALPPLTVETLNAHRVEQRQEMMRLRLVWQDHDLVFPAEDGSPCPPPRVSVQFTRLARSLGLGITFHGLRHTHATHLLRAGIHPKIASGRLGHANISITMDTYSHLLGDDQEEAAARIDGMIRTVLK